MTAELTQKSASQVVEVDSDSASEIMNAMMDYTINIPVKKRLNNVNVDVKRLKVEGISNNNENEDPNVLRRNPTILVDETKEARNKRIEKCFRQLERCKNIYLIAKEGDAPAEIKNLEINRHHYEYSMMRGYDCCVGSGFTNYFSKPKIRRNVLRIMAQIVNERQEIKKMNIYMDSKRNNNKNDKYKYLLGYESDDDDETVNNEAESLNPIDYNYYRILSPDVFNFKFNSHRYRKGVLKRILYENYGSEGIDGERFTTYQSIKDFIIDNDGIMPKYLPNIRKFEKN